MTSHLQIHQKEENLKPLRATRHFTSFSGSKWVALSYLAFLGLAELLVALGLPQLGMLFHSLIVLALLLHESQSKQPIQRNFLLALILAPLIRLISLMMPLTLFPVIYWYMITAVPLFVALYLITRQIGLTRERSGLILSNPGAQLLIILSGPILGYIEYLILRPSPLITELRWELVWAPALILLIFTGFLEEMVFRGLLQSTTLAYLGRYTILYVSAIFAVLHLGYKSALDLIFVFFVALFFSYVVKYSRSILGVSIAHGLINIGIYLVFPFIFAMPATLQGSQFSEINVPTIAQKPVFTSTSPVPVIQATPEIMKTLAPVRPTNTPRITPKALLLEPTIMIPDAPQPTPANDAACPQAIPARLEVGMQARVNATVYLRLEPGPSKHILDILQPGTQLEIIGGPVCVNYLQGAYRWWNVKLEDGRTGWSAEGSLKGAAYFLVPFP
jgi:hypothetical protein